MSSTRSTPPGSGSPASRSWPSRPWCSPRSRVASWTGCSRPSAPSRWGLAVPSLAEIGGFLFVAAAFLALPATLRAGVHVRVTLLTGALRGAAARAVATLTLCLAAALAAFAAWSAAAQVADSLAFDAVSYGVIRVPLWIPQLAMTAGLALLLLALLDELAAVLRGRTPAHARAEAARGDGRAAQGEGR